MSRTNEFVININGQLCISKKGNFKCWGAFAEAYLYGLTDFLNERLKECEHHNHSGLFNIEINGSLLQISRGTIDSESFNQFRDRVRVEIFDFITNEIINWWKADPDPKSKSFFDPLALPGNIFGPYNPVLVKWPTFSVTFGNYGKDFVRDKRLEDIDFFILWMTMEIPGLARIAKEKAIENFNNGDKSLTFSHGRLPFKAEPDQTAEEFGESVRLQVRQTHYSYVTTDLRLELEEEAYPWIDAEVDPNMFADVPNDDEARYAELLANPPTWFLADETE